METSFTDLRNKQVINVLTGRLLGNVCDIIFDLRCNNILGLIVPGTKSTFNFFKPCQEIFVPLSCICKVGEDVILVEVVEPNPKKKKRNNARIYEIESDEKEEEYNEQYSKEKNKEQQKPYW